MCVCVRVCILHLSRGRFGGGPGGCDAVECLLAGRWAGKRRLTPCRWVEVRQENEGLSGAAYAGRYI